MINQKIDFALGKFGKFSNVSIAYGTLWKFPLIYESARTERNSKVTKLITIYYKSHTHWYIDPYSRQVNLRLTLYTACRQEESELHKLTMGHTNFRDIRWRDGTDVYFLGLDMCYNAIAMGALAGDCGTSKSSMR